MATVIVETPPHVSPYDPRTLTELYNHVFERRSAVTGFCDAPELEPYVSYAQIYAHESVWLDSADIPSTPSLAPLYEIDELGKVRANVQDADRRDELGGGVITKRVRVKLTKADFPHVWIGNESVMEGGISLRRIVHENINSGLDYRPIIEVRSKTNPLAIRTLGDHEWKLNYLSGLLWISSSSSASPVPLDPGTEDVLITAYEYTGRIGVPRSADELADGSLNRFFTPMLFNEHFSYAISSITTDDVVEGLRHKFYDESRTKDDVREMLVGRDVTTDDLAEGVHSQYFSRERVDAVLDTKTLADFPETETHHLYRRDHLLSVNAPIRGVTELRFSSLLDAPEDKANKMYVEREGDEDWLYFNGTRIDGGGASGSGGGIATALATGGGSEAAGVGEFAGVFRGATSGVHSGDVIGNVTGTVSSLHNHPVIESKLLGDGEGHWTGTMYGSLTGTFDGHANITTGAFTNAYNIAVGTYDTDAALVHVSGIEDHLRLTHTESGLGGTVECAGDGSIVVRGSSSLDVRSALKAQTLSCAGDVCVRGHAYMQHVNAVGITNNYSGIYEAGVISGAETIDAERGNIGTLSVAALYIGGSSSVFSADEVNASSITALGGIYGADLTVTGSIIGPIVDAQIGYIDHLSVSSVYATATSSLKHVRSDDVTAGYIECGELRVSAINATGVVIAPHLLIPGGLLDSGHVVALTASIGSMFSDFDKSYFSQSNNFHGVMVEAVEVTAAHIVVSDLYTDFLEADRSAVGALSVGRLFIGGGDTGRMGTGTLLIKHEGGCGDDAIDPNDSMHFGSIKVDGNCLVTGTIYAGDGFRVCGSALEIDYFNVGTLSAGTVFAQSMEALSINALYNTTFETRFISTQGLVSDVLSVGKLTWGVIQGLDALDDLFELADPDGVHQGNLLVKGNLMIEGVVITGSYNTLVNDDKRMGLDGVLSVSGPMYVDDLDVRASVLSLQQAYADLKSDFERLMYSHEQLLAQVVSAIPAM